MDRRAPDHFSDLAPPELVRSGGVTLRVRRLEASAAGTGPRLILFHGGPGLDHHLLLPLGLALAERHEVWLPDLPGHGTSVGPHETAPPGLRSLEARVERWLRGLIVPGGSADTRETALVGHSLGAWLVRELVRPGGIAPPIRAAVLLAPPAAGQRERGSALRRAGSLTRRGRRASGRYTVQHEARSEARARRDVLAHVEAETSGSPAPLFLAALARAHLRDARHYAALTAELHRRLVAPSKPCAPGCPVLVLCGEGDRTTPPDQARRVADGLEGARLEVLPGAGHYPFADALEETASAIERFLIPESGQRTR